MNVIDMAATRNGKFREVDDFPPGKTSESFLKPVQEKLKELSNDLCVRKKYMSTLHVKHLKELKAEASVRKIDNTTIIVKELDKYLLLERMIK